MLAITPHQINHFAEEDRKRFLAHVFVNLRELQEKIGAQPSTPISERQCAELIGYFERLGFVEERQLLVLASLLTVYRAAVADLGLGDCISEIIRDRFYDANERFHALLLILPSDFRDQLTKDRLLWLES